MSLLLISFEGKAIIVDNNGGSDSLEDTPDERRYYSIGGILIVYLISHTSKNNYFSKFMMFL